MKNILLMNFGGIGDEILFLPVVKSLKEDFQNSEITLILEPRSASIQALSDNITRVIKCDIKACGFKKYLNVLKLIFEVRKNKYDFVVASGSSPLVAILCFLFGVPKRYGFKSKTSFLCTNDVKLNKNQYAGQMYHDLIAPISNKVCVLPQITLKADFEMPFSGDFVALHPGVSKMSVMKNMIKCPSAPFWRELIEGILAKGERVVLLGGPDDEEIISQIGNFENENFYNLYGKTKNLQELASIISKSSAFICADSAPMHIAVALNKKIFAIFGPTDDKKLIPNAENFKVIKGAKCDLKPCLWARRQTTCNTLACLKINPNDIISQI